MIFAPEIPADCNIRIVEDVNKYSWATGTLGHVSPTEFTIDRIRVGEAYYKLFSPIELMMSWRDNSWICWTKELGSDCVGVGKNCYESEEQLKKMIHAKFQSLYRKRPFEMSETERKDWNAICKVIDVRYYRETTPVPSREIGRVHWDNYQYPKRIEWISGRNDYIDLAKSPAEFASCKPGQWIEAVTHRCPKTGHLRDIEYVARIETIHQPATSEIERFLEKIEEADLPESEWDWPVSD